MNAHTDPRVTEVQGIERSLDELLTAITKHDAQPKPFPRAFKAESMADITANIEAHLARTKAGRFTYALQRDAVREALCHAVRMCGERLHEIGGLTAMQDACDRVADMDPSSWGRRTSVMDARWDGIGREGGKAGWCS